MTLTEVRQSLIDYLNLQGVHALGAWAGDARLTHPAGVAVVGLKSLSCAPMGHQDYLGQRYVEAQNALCAVYVRRLELVFSLDLYAPMGEPEVCLALFDRLAQAVCLGGPEGLTCGELSCGDLTYDSDSRTLTCPARLTCQAGCALYQTEEGEVFTDFVVKGELIS